MGASAVGVNDSAFAVADVVAVAVAVAATAAAIAVAETLSSKIGGGSSRLSAAEVRVREVTLVADHGKNPSVDRGYWEDASSSSELRADSPCWESFPEN